MFSFGPKREEQSALPAVVWLGTRWHTLTLGEMSQPNGHT